MPRGLCYVDVLSVSDLFGVPEEVEVPEEGRNFPNKMQFGQICVIIIGQIEKVVSRQICKT